MLTTILAYVLGAFVGLLLGLIGGGGVFMLPITLFLLKQPIALATAHSTILVGLTTLVGAIPRIRSGEVDWPTVLALGIPVTAGMLLVRGWLFYQIPTEIVSIFGWVLTKEILVLALFTVMLLLSFASMNDLILTELKPNTQRRQEQPVRYYTTLVICGLIVGIVPGLAGAGGGVLIVPLLVVFFGLPMKTVVGTSLTIVAIKSIVGFSGDIYNQGGRIDLPFLVSFIAVMLVGAAAGTILAHRMDARKLKKFFAWFVLALAIFIPIKVLWFPSSQPGKTEPVMEQLESSR